MSSNIDQLTADAMKLPLRDRVQLAQRLVSTLDDGVESGTEALWFAEAERRLEELRSGKVQGIELTKPFAPRAKLSSDETIAQVRVSGRPPIAQQFTAGNRID